MRAAEQWNRLPREAVLSCSWEFLRPDCIKPGVTWSDLRADPVLSRRLGLDDLLRSFTTRIFL